MPGSRVRIPPWCSAQVIGFVVGVGLASTVFVGWGIHEPPLDRLAGSGVGKYEQPFPLRARGWLNGPAPTWASLRGKVVVVDVWTET